MEVKVEVNTINVVNELKRISSKQKPVILKALNNIDIVIICGRIKKKSI